MTKKSKAPEVVLPKMGDVALAASTQSEEADEALELIRGIALRTNQELAGAVGVVAEMKEKRAAVDEQLKRFTAPLKGVIKDIEGFFKPAIKALDECEVLIKRKISDYTAGEAVQRDRLLADAGEAAQQGDAVAARALVVKADAHLVDKVPGLSMREQWDGEVVDAEAIPREFLIPDVKALKALTRAKKCDPKIPGWRAHCGTTVAITTSRVER